MPYARPSLRDHLGLSDHQESSARLGHDPSEDLSSLHNHVSLLKNSATKSSFLLVMTIKCATQMFRRSTLNDG